MNPELDSVSVMRDSFTSVELRLVDAAIADFHREVLHRMVAAQHTEMARAAGKRWQGKVEEAIEQVWLDEE